MRRNTWACVLILAFGGSAGLATAPAAATSESVTFSRDIAPILFEHCASCHRPGEIAPFSLLSYDDARRHAHEIAELTADHTMPPWKPAEHFGEFRGERRLDSAQIDLIQRWVAQGKPEGNAADLPPAPQFNSGWTLGEPDLVVRMPEAYTLPADGPDRYRVFVIPLNLKEDVYISALEFRPSNPRIVHHSLFYLDRNGIARQLEAESPKHPGYARVGGPGFVPTGGLGGWAPGVTPRFLPDNVGWPVRAGSDLVLHTHFHPSGKVEKEQSAVGLYFTKTKPNKVIVSIPHGTNKINIEPGDDHYVVKSSFRVPTDVEVEGIFPHAHLICKQIKVTAKLPDGSDLPLIWIKDWDWNWQDFYHYSKVLKVPAGTMVTQEFTYDNSAANPHNPSSPPQRVHYGEQTKDEMSLVFYQILLDRSQAELYDAFLRRPRRLRGANATPTTRPADAAQ